MVGFNIINARHPPNINLSSATVDEGAAPKTVGTLSVSRGGYTLSIAADPDNKFALSGNNLVTDQTTDFSVAETHSVTIRASKSGQPDIDSTFTIFVLDSAPAPDTVITRHGFTWTLEGTVENGTYVNGDPWVVGPVNVLSVAPGWDGTKHGSAVDPLTNTGNQPFTNVPGYTGGAIIFLPYSATERVDFPLTINPAGGIKSLVSTESLNQQMSGGGNDTLKSAAVLTVVSSTPAANSFRPPYCGGCEKRQYTTADVNYGLLPNLVSVGVPLIPKANPNLVFSSQRMLYADDSPPASVYGRAGEYVCERVWLDHAHYLGSGVIHPRDNMAVYPAINIRFLSRALVYTLCRVEDAPDKIHVTNLMIQHGIDIWGISQTNKNGFKAGAGFGHGRKMAALFAAHLLEEPDMIPAVYIQASEVGGVGNAIELQHKHGEDGHTYYGSGGAALWGLSKHTSPVQTWNTGADIWPGAEGGSWGTGVITNHDIRDPNGVLFPEDDPAGGGGSYRSCCSSLCYVGQALVAQQLGLEAAWGWPAFFDYVERWVSDQDWPNAGSAFYNDTNGYGGTGNGWMKNMFDTYYGT